MSVVYLRELEADWELGLIALPGIMRESTHISPWKRSKIVKTGSTISAESVSFLYHCKIKKNFLSKLPKAGTICNYLGLCWPIREGHGTPLQYSCLENPMDGGVWKAAVHGVAKSRTRLRDFTFTFHFRALEKEWQPTPVFLPGESQGRGSLVGCRLWGRTESDTTEATQQQQQRWPMQ